MTRLEAIVRPEGEVETGLTFVDSHGRATFTTYEEVGRQAVAAAAAMAGKGVGPGDAVGLVVENDLESVVAAWGAWAAGATLVSLPPPPRRFPELYRDAFAPVLQSMGCRVVAGRGAAASVLAGSVPTLRLDPDRGAGARDPEPRLEGIALVQFTSGSVGQPKGVALSAATVADHVDALGAALAAEKHEDRGLSWVPLYHDMGFVATFLTLAARRVPLTIMTPVSFILNPRGWLRACAEARATLTIGSDFAFRLASRASAGEALDLSSIRYIFSGGERVSWTTLSDFHRVTEPMGLRWEAITPMYGLAEATAAVTMPPLGRGPIQGPDGTVSSGVPLPGVELDVATTLRVRSPWLLDGYLTADGLKPATTDGWFTTGDTASVVGGEVFVRGRKDEVVVQAGQNYFAEDVEAVALRAAGAAAVGVSAFRVAHELSRFALAIEMVEVPGDDARALGRALQGAASAALGIRVGPVLVLKPWTIPRTTSGKVRRSECRVMLDEDRWPPARVLALLP